MLTDRQGNASIEQACGLAEEIVRTFGEVRLRVFGTSMVPAILPGDLVTVQRATLQEISVGEVILYFRQSRLFVHRVVGRSSTDALERSSLITRGDRLLHDDDPPVFAIDLLGRVVHLERDHRVVELRAGAMNPLLDRALQSSERATYLYLRLAALRGSFSFRRAKCRA
jgi:signal peptidase I